MATPIGSTVKSEGVLALHREVALDQPARAVAHAVLVATAHGIYEAQVNGVDASKSLFEPGWTVYENRLQVQRYDVADAVRSGQGCVSIDIRLGRGWWNGDFGFHNARANYGDNLAFVGVLLVTFQDGTEQRMPTDTSWTVAPTSVVFATIYDGQHDDRRLGLSAPVAAVEAQMDRSTFTDPVSPPITRHEVLRPAKIWTAPSGKTLVDFGQNLVGWLRFTVEGPAGTEIVMRHAEVLEEGELGVRPLRSAKATDRIVLSGSGAETFEPTFTFHGFRFAEIVGWPGEITANDIEAVVVHSAIERTGRFECSDSRVNQLVHNSVWSQKGNFLAAPTDCPQRDERLGWTGDIAAYAATAAFQFDVSEFLHGWLLDLGAETRLNPDKYVPIIVPEILKHAEYSPPSMKERATPTAVWGDAAVWVPEALWHAYGDLDKLRDHYPAMVLHLESVEKELSPSGLWNTGFQFADWLDPDAPSDRPGDAKADKGVVATACLVRSARFAAETAWLIGEEADAERWQELAERTREAFLSAYVGPDGRIHSDAPTAYALAITFDVLTDEQRPKAASRLAELVREARYRISTGFAGTPYVTWALSETGHIEEAYRLLLEEHCPSWLYPVSMGATTIWERWDSMLPNGSINPGEMTSFNHYALGAVADWIYKVVLGIRPAAPGYARVRIQPTPGPGVDWVRGSLRSPVGDIAVSWSTINGRFALEVKLPIGVEADVALPDGTTQSLTGTGAKQSVCS